MIDNLLKRVTLAGAMPLLLATGAFGDIDIRYLTRVDGLSGKKSLYAMVMSPSACKVIATEMSLALSYTPVRFICETDAEAGERAPNDTAVIREFLVVRDKDANARVAAATLVDTHCGALSAIMGAAAVRDKTGESYACQHPPVAKPDANASMAR